jgi:hypothetical protein
MPERRFLHHEYHVRTIATQSLGTAANAGATQKQGVDFASPRGISRLPGGRYRFERHLAKLTIA